MPNINQVILKARELDELAKKTDLELKACKGFIQDYFDKKELFRYEVKDSMIASSKVMAIKTERVYITYLVDKLKAKLDKEMWPEIINKTHTINDYNGLVSLMKAYGVSPKEFKEFIGVVEAANGDKIKQLYAVGDITKEDIKGCFEVKITKSIQIKVEEGGKN